MRRAGAAQQRTMAQRALNLLVAVTAALAQTLGRDKPQSN